MCFKKIFDMIFKSTNNLAVKQPELSRERIAQHEAAHGIVWYLFKNNWTVNKLTIERDGLPDDDMNGALHITAKFDVNKESNIERANELFAIALAGMIGQNMNILIQRENLWTELGRMDFNLIFDKSGCGGDFEIAKKPLPYLGQEFKTKQGVFTQRKVMDLVTLFQEHTKVQAIHLKLTQLLLDRGTLTEEELNNFFELQNFQEYIEDENLDINFYHR
jgi:hypothetical protein